MQTVVANIVELLHDDSQLEDPQDKINKLESLVRMQEIEIKTLKENNRLLALENVKLLNKPDPTQMRQYETDKSIPDDKPLQDHKRKRNVGTDKSLHPRVSRVC